MKDAIILMGLPLSGKTTYIKNNYCGIDVISADELKENHIKYDPQNTESLHQWSVEEAEAMVYRCINYKRSFILDSGSINNNYTVRIINKLKSCDYRVKLIHIKTPYEVCIDRLNHRERKVPIKSILDKAVIENSQFHRLKSLVDEVEVVNYFTNKYIFVDMDGVIAAMGTLPIVDGKIDFVNSNVFAYAKPVNQVISKLNYIIATAACKQMFILSAAPNSISISEKNSWLDKYFPIPKDDRFFVNQGKHKAEMLNNLCYKFSINKSDCLLVDDTIDILYDTKALGINAMHVSEFLVHEF